MDKSGKSSPSNRRDRRETRDFNDLRCALREAGSMVDVYPYIDRSHVRVKGAMVWRVPRPAGGLVMVLGRATIHGREEVRG